MGNGTGSIERIETGAVAIETERYLSEFDPPNLNAWFAWQIG